MHCSPTHLSGYSRHSKTNFGSKNQKSTPEPTPFAEEAAAVSEAIFQFGGGSGDSFLADILDEESINDLLN